MEVTPNKYEMLNETFFETFDRPERIKVYYGGAGSGKSLSIMQHFILKLCEGDGIRLAVFRKHFPSMKASTYLVLKDILTDWQIPYEENKTDHVIRVGSNELYYLSLDDPEKIKGAEYAEVWLEEATEFREEDYNQLKIRLSRTSEDAIIYMSFNPISAQHWIIKNVVNSKDPRIFVHHSTYLDNTKFLSKAFIEELESFINTDENFYRIYALGQPGVLKGRIFTHAKYEDPADWPSNWQEGIHVYGLDFGFNNPSAMCECWIHEGDVCYCKELFYEREKTTDDLIDMFAEIGVDKRANIYADAAEPDRIQMIKNAGYRCFPAKKDVRAGIDSVKAIKLRIDGTCSPNMQKEDFNYKWKEDKDGNTLEEPVKAFDHLMDARRYAIYSSVGRPSGFTQIKFKRPSIGSCSMPKF